MKDVTALSSGNTTVVKLVNPEKLGTVVTLLLKVIVFKEVLVVNAFGSILVTVSGIV